MASAPPVKKACDACHRRKVRCSGGQPCKNCGQANLQCTYLAVPQKKGPKGSRAKVISEIRDGQQQKGSPPKSSLQSTPSTQAAQEIERSPFDFSIAPQSPITTTRNLDLLSSQTVESCINFFLGYLYPTMPIFSRQHLNALAMEYRSASSEVYCLVLALCTFIIVQPGMSFEGMPMPASYTEDPTAARYRLANMLLREIHYHRKDINYVDYPTIHSVQISFFLFCSYFGLDKPNACWYYLREASTLAHMLNMNEEATYKIGDQVENIRNRRFYWLVLLTERAHAIQRHKPLSMLATIELPSVEPNTAETQVLHGFVFLATLFRAIDDEFMAVWNKAKSGCTTTYLIQLQLQLVDALPPTLDCTENQAADVRITQHWLRCMVWQLSMTNGYLKSNSEDASMTFNYPIEIARDLLRDIRDISLEAMEVHGIGLIEKLFDMSCTLSDVITYVPFEHANGDSQAPQDYLNQLLNLISRLRGGASRYVPMLMSKVQEHLPNMSNPLTHMPHSLDAFMESSPSTSSSPGEMIRPIHIARSQLPMQIQVPTNVLHSPYPSSSSQTGFTDQVLTPQSQTMHHERLMFEQYSPSVNSYTDTGMTPPVYGLPGTPQQQYTPTAMAMAQPRSIPISAAPIKHEGWDGYHG